MAAGVNLRPEPLPVNENEPALSRHHRSDLPSYLLKLFNPVRHIPESVGAREWGIRDGDASKRTESLPPLTGTDVQHKKIPSPALEIRFHIPEVRFIDVVETLPVKSHTAVHARADKFGEPAEWRVSRGLHTPQGRQRPPSTTAE
jgi:hypothetical protein